MNTEETSFEVISSSQGKSYNGQDFYCPCISWMFMPWCYSHHFNLFCCEPSLMKLLVALRVWLCLVGSLCWVRLDLYCWCHSLPEILLPFWLYVYRLCYPDGNELKLYFHVYTQDPSYYFPGGCRHVRYYAVAGYTTKMDLTRFGSLMFMGLIGIVIDGY